MGKLIGIARRECKRGDMQTLTQAEVATASGVSNDFRGKPGKRQVTVMSAEAWRLACQELVRDLSWTTRRANLLIEGIELPRTVGSVIEIAGVALEVTMETDPCSRMDEQCKGLRDALKPDWRGGVCCRVLSGGELAIGNTVYVRAASAA